MYYHFDQFQGVGMSNSDVFLIEKAVPFDIRVKNYEQEEKERRAEEEEEDLKCGDDNGNLRMPALKGEVVDVEDENDGFRTPTSVEHKIPVPQQCPPAPRKPKSVPCSRKRKACSSVRDLSIEIDMLFPQPRLFKIKKARGYTK